MSFDSVNCNKKSPLWIERLWFLQKLVQLAVLCNLRRGRLAFESDYALRRLQSQRPASAVVRNQEIATSPTLLVTRVMEVTIGSAFLERLPNGVARLSRHRVLTLVKGYAVQGSLYRWQRCTAKFQGATNKVRHIPESVTRHEEPWRETFYVFFHAGLRFHTAPFC